MMGRTTQSKDIARAGDRVVVIMPEDAPQF